MKINEVTGALEGLSIEKVLGLIQTECSDYLATCGGRAMFRGGKFTGMSFKASPRPNRKPMHSGAHWQSKIDQRLQEGGIAALRSNSAFCTSTYEDAAEYGRVFCVFPVNGFSFAWSKVLEDLWEQFFPSEDKWLAFSKIPADRLQYIHAHGIGNTPEEFSKITGLDESEYGNFTGHINWNAFLFFLDLQLLSGKEFVTKYKFSDTNLANALRSKSEIYLHGAYYAVEVSVLEDEGLLIEDHLVM